MLKPVRIDRPAGRLGQVVVHQPEKRRGQHETDRVVPVPPLHEGVLHAGVNRIALHRPGRQFQAVEDVQDGDRDDRGDVEPQRHVHVPFAAAEERAEEVDREDDPDHGDRQVDGPFQFGILLARREAQRNRDAPRRR